MKKKNGFIAISLIYSFFLMFIAIMMGLLANYTQSKLILDKVNTTLYYKAQKKLSDIILRNNEDKGVLTDLSSAEPSSSSDNTGSGLYKTEDYDGTSYYFRGQVDNNYVKFGTYGTDYYRIVFTNNSADSEKKYVQYSTSGDIDCGNYKWAAYEFFSQEECENTASIKSSELINEIDEPIIWRIVRINGDGSIRLIMENPAGTSQFNYLSDDIKYVGYTYDSTTGVNTDGVNSTIKTFLESWYNTNLKENYDDYILTSTFVNDTYPGDSISSNTYFGSYERYMMGYSYSLNINTPSGTGNYGGKYSLKIGLLSADEASFAGIREATINNYLAKENPYWTMSPSKYYSEAYIYVVNSNTSGTSVNLYGDNYTADESNIFVYPVINLKSDTVIESGDGTEGNPYVIK